MKMYFPYDDLILAAIYRQDIDAVHSIVVKQKSPKNLKRLTEEEYEAVKTELKLSDSPTPWEIAYAMIRKISEDEKQSTSATSEAQGGSTALTKACLIFITCFCNRIKLAEINTDPLFGFFYRTAKQYQSLINPEALKELQCLDSSILKYLNTKNLNTELASEHFYHFTGLLEKYLHPKKVGEEDKKLIQNVTLKNVRKFHDSCSEKLRKQKIASQKQGDTADLDLDLDQPQSFDLFTGNFKTLEDLLGAPEGDSAGLSMTNLAAAAGSPNAEKHRSAGRFNSMATLAGDGEEKNTDEEYASSTGSADNTRQNHDRDSSSCGCFATFFKTVLRKKYRGEYSFNTQESHTQFPGDGSKSRLPLVRK